jgi:hypothetical protein
MGSEIAAHCPKAWVINYTNPMTICRRTLTRVEPALKVFGTQRHLAAVAAFFNDPANRLPIDESWGLYKELLSYSAPWLPGWKIA